MRCLLPAALLVTSGAALPTFEGEGVITIDADSLESASGPLSVADALARHRLRRGM